MDINKNVLSVLLSKINTYGNRIYNGENLSQIEIDILKDKLKDAYELLLDSSVEQPQNEVLVEEKEVEQPQNIPLEKVEECCVQQEPEPLQEIEDEILFKQETFFQSEELEQQNEPSQAAEIEDEQIKVNNIIENTPSVLKYLHENIINDAAKEKYSQSPLNLFAEKQTTVADKFTDKQTVNDRVNETMKGDLRTNIGVNEKFLFINDLFFGNMKGYADFIQELNSGETWEQANAIINNYKQQKQWIESSSAFTTLTLIIEKRFKNNRI